MLRKLEQLGSETLKAKVSLSEETLKSAASIIESVRTEGLEAVCNYAQKFGDIANNAPLFYDKAALNAALQQISDKDRKVLERTSARIRKFAEAQRQCVSELNLDIPGGKAGHKIIPVESVGCYVPGGRFPLPSTALMTAITARVAGAKHVWVASPKPQAITLAAAALADADGLIATGGAQAIAAFAFGIEPLPRADLIVGPGNRWVTAAKKLLYGEVGIDMLAGPTELLIIADSKADPATIAADLIAQAEHDPDAKPMLICSSEELASAVNAELTKQLKTLPARDIATAALKNGFWIKADTVKGAAEISNQLAPEHLQLHCSNSTELDSAALVPLLTNYGALFIGRNSAEVLGDYGIGPNHVLPTEGTAHFSSGLSIFNFLQIRSWVEVTDCQLAEEAIADAVSLARLEGLEGHARAAERRK